MDVATRGGPNAASGALAPEPASQRLPPVLMLINMSAMAADSEWLTAARACALLDVKRATLYAYVSRGLVRSRAVAGSRTRLYHRDDLSALKVRHDTHTNHTPITTSTLH